ncbi:15499_t:CDS:2, partial [Funneliformis geosporum]
VPEVLISVPVTTIRITAIADSCYKLECLNISNRKEFSEISICNIIHSCLRFQQLDLSYCEITDITIEEIAKSSNQDSISDTDYVSETVVVASQLIIANTFQEESLTMDSEVTYDIKTIN